MFILLFSLASWFGRRRRSLLSQQRRNEYFDMHVRRKRFLDKILCDGITGGGCKGEIYPMFLC